MQTPQFSVKKLFADAVVPTKAHVDDAGFDLVAHRIFKETSDVVFWGTGVAVQPPEGYYFHVYPRSSVSKTRYMLANSVGIIDSGYQGELIVAMRKVGSDDGAPYSVGDRIAQLVPMRCDPMNAVVVEEFQQRTTRGDGGFGSTGN